jgi:(R)-2-hydroxyacyl-CoA dehydratese activating ATPase
MAYFMGIDIGSGRSKGVLARDEAIAAVDMTASGINYAAAAAFLKSALIKKAGVKETDIVYIVATGQGSSCVKFSDKTVSDIRCCARGIQNLLPQARTVIDIEAQTTQVFHVGEGGQLANFVISEKCASGSGYFLEMIANVLQISLEETGPLSLKSSNPVSFSNACAVFGESEAVSRVAEGVPREDILAGIHRALAEKIGVMVERIGFEADCAVCGGGALNCGLVAALEAALKTRLLVPLQPQMVTALGAALLARDSAARKD